MEASLSVQQLFTLRAIYMAIDDVLRLEEWEQKLSLEFPGINLHALTSWKLIFSEEGEWIYTNIFDRRVFSESFITEVLRTTLNHLKDMPNLEVFSMIDFEFLKGLDAERAYTLMNQHSEFF